VGKFLALNGHELAWGTSDSLAFSGQKIVIVCKGSFSSPKKRKKKNVEDWATLGCRNLQVLKGLLERPQNRPLKIDLDSRQKTPKGG